MTLCRYYNGEIFEGKNIIQAKDIQPKNIIQSKDSLISEVLKIWAVVNFEDRLVSDNHFPNQSL